MLVFAKSAIYLVSQIFGMWNQVTCYLTIIIEEYQHVKGTFILMPKSKD